MCIITFTYLIELLFSRCNFFFLFLLFLALLPFIDENKYKNPTHRKESLDFLLAHLSGDDEAVEEEAEDGEDHLEDGVDTQEHEDCHDGQGTAVGVVLHKVQQ